MVLKRSRNIWILIAIVAVVMIGCLVECCINGGILSLSSPSRESYDELRIMSVTTPGMPVRVGVPFGLPNEALDVLSPILGRRGAREVQVTHSMQESNIWLGDALDALNDKDKDNDNDKDRWWVIGVLPTVKWHLLLVVELPPKSKMPESLRELIKDEKTWPKIELMLPQTQQHASNSSMGERKARVLAARAWAATTVAHNEGALQTAERSGRVVVSLWRPSKSKAVPWIVVRMTWTASSSMSSNPKERENHLPYIFPTKDTYDALTAIAPEMKVEKVKVRVSEERPSEEIEVLVSRGVFLRAPNAKVKVNNSQKEPGGIDAVSDQMSELLVKDVNDAAEVSVLEMLGAKVTEASSKRVRDLTEHRMRSVQKMSPYGYPSVPIREQFENVELVPEAKDAPTVLEVRYPQEFRDATKGIANPREGGAVREVIIQEHVFQGVRLKRGDRVVLPDNNSNKGAFVVVSSDPQVVLQRPVVLRIASQVRRERMRSGTSGWVWELTGRPADVDADLVPSLRRGDEVLWALSSKDQKPVLGTVKTAGGSLVSVEVPVERMEASLNTNVRALVETRDWLHPLSRCSGDSKVPTRTLCEGGKTLDVLPDSEGGSVTASVWDRPCEHDNDCPYYSSTTGRGGCLGGGMCEVPLGVRRVGYRHVDPKRSEPALCWRNGQNKDDESCDAPVFSITK